MKRVIQREPRETKYLTPVTSDAATDVPTSFEEAYLRFAPLLRKIAMKKFGIAVTEAEPLVHDVFATYFANVDEVVDVGPYLVGGICNAARHYLRRLDARDAIFCGEVSCVAAPGESILQEVERKLLLRRLLARVGSRCRELLHRYYLIGESTSTIASALHFKPMTVLICLAKCRKRARAAYYALTETPRT